MTAAVVLLLLFLIVVVVVVGTFVIFDGAATDQVLAHSFDGVAVCLTS